MSFGSRLLTFGLNVFIARRVDRRAYGIGFVSLELFNALGLFLSKEGFRRASIRLLRDDRSEGKNSIIVCWSSMIVSTVINLFLLGIWLSGQDSSQTPNYTVAVVLMFVANILEIVAEPLVLNEIIQKRLDSKPYVEGVALTMRTFSLSLLSLGLGANFLLSFAAAQIVYSLTWISGFLFYARQYGGIYDVVSSLTLPCSPLELVRTRKWKSLWLKEKRHGDLCQQMLIGACQKMILGKGENVILVALFDEAAWSSYALVSNFGSLILRTLFAPVEEIAFSYFSTADGSFERRDRLHIARILLGIQGALGAIALGYGPTYGYFALRLLYGRGWADDEDAVSAFQLYCVFLFAASLNGIMEAYAHATADVQWMRRNVFFQIACSTVLCVASWTLRSYGARGLIVATTCSMALRVVRCLFFLSPPLRWVHPRVPTLYASIFFSALIAWGISSSCTDVMSSSNDAEADLRPFLVRLAKEFAVALTCLSMATIFRRSDLKALVSELVSLKAVSDKPRKEKAQ